MIKPAIAPAPPKVGLPEWQTPNYRLPWKRRHVASWHKAEVLIALRDVRSLGRSRHRGDGTMPPSLLAQTGGLSLGRACQLWPGIQTSTCSAIEIRSVSSQSAQGRTGDNRLRRLTHS